MITLEEARGSRDRLATLEMQVEDMVEVEHRSVKDAEAYYDLREELEAERASFYASVLEAVADGHALGHQLAQIALGREVCVQTVEHTAATSGVVR
jgi:hypothetical protein